MELIVKLISPRLITDSNQNTCSDTMSHGMGFVFSFKAIKVFLRPLFDWICHFVHLLICSLP